MKIRQSPHAKGSRFLVRAPLGVGNGGLLKACACCIDVDQGILLLNKWTALAARVYFCLSRPARLACCCCPRSRPVFRGSVCACVRPWYRTVPGGRTLSALQHADTRQPISTGGTSCRGFLRREVCDSFGLRGQVPTAFDRVLACSSVGIRHFLGGAHDLGSSQSVRVLHRERPAEPPAHVPICTHTEPRGCVNPCCFNNSASASVPRTGHASPDLTLSRLSGAEHFRIQNSVKRLQDVSSHHHHTCWHTVMQPTLGSCSCFRRPGTRPSLPPTQTRKLEDR